MSSVIKTFSAQRLRDGGTFNLEDLTVRASAYLADVRAQAASLLVKAQGEAVEIRQRAEQEGRQAAQRAAEAQIDERIGKQMASLLPALSEAVQGIVQARQTWLAHSETTMLKVATAIASRIARREVTTSARHHPDADSRSAGNGGRQHPDPTPAASGRPCRTGRPGPNAGGGTGAGRRSRGHRRRGDFARRMPRRHALGKHRSTI